MRGFKPSRTFLILAGIFFVACLVRFWGIGFGLPQTQCRPDESIVVEEALHFFSGDLNPHYFNYGTLLQYLIFLLYGASFLFSQLCGNITSLQSFLASFTLSPTPFYLLARFFVSFLGALSVILLFRIVRQLFGERTGIIAALFLAVAYLHARDSHFATVDIPLTFFILCSMYFIVKSLQKKTVFIYVLSGVFAGFACATKYAGIFLVVPMYYAHFLNTRGEGKRLIDVFLDRRILFFILSLLLAFFALVPFIFTDAWTFSKYFFNELELLERGRGIVLGRGWWYHLRFSLWMGLGWSMFLTSLIGIALLFRKNLKLAVLMLLFPFAYYLFAGKFYSVVVRYMIPVIPFLCAVAAFAAVFLYDLLCRHLNSKSLKGILFFSLAGFIISPSLCNLIWFNRISSRTDSRVRAYEWVEKNIGSRDQLYQTGSGYAQIQPPTDWVFYPQNRTFQKAARVSFERPGAVAVPELTPVPGNQSSRYPQYIAIIDSPVRVFTPVVPGIKEIVSNRYALIKTFIATDYNAENNHFDLQDAFFIPLAGFQGVYHPGPNIYIFKRLSKDRSQ